MALPLIEKLFNSVEQRVKKDIYYAGDLNDINNTEVGNFAYGCLNVPWTDTNGGHLVTIKMSDNYIYQFAVNSLTGKKFERIKASGTWKQWEGITKIEGMAVPSNTSITLPYIDPTILDRGIGVFADTNNIYIKTGDNKTTYVATINLYYTKLMNF